MTQDSSDVRCHPLSKVYTDSHMGIKEERRTPLANRNRVILQIHNTIVDQYTTLRIYYHCDFTIAAPKKL